MGRLRERKRELAAVELLLARGGVLVVEGRAGIGKTALAEEAGRRAGELGHQVVRARGSALEAGFAFGVVRQLFERCLADADAGEREALLAGPAAAVRPLLSGPLRSPAGDIPPTGRPVTADYIQVLRFRDGKHASFSLMYGRLQMLEQPGLIPAPAG